MEVTREAEAQETGQVEPAVELGPPDQGRHGVQVEERDMAGGVGWGVALAGAADRARLLPWRHGQGTTGAGLVIMGQVCQTAGAQVQPGGPGCPAEDAGGG
jgi:hypothetical protein